MRTSPPALVLALSASVGCTSDAVMADDTGLSAGSEGIPDTTTSGAGEASTGSSEATSAATENGSTTSLTTDEGSADGPKLDVSVDTDAVEPGCSDEAPNTIYVLLATTPAEIWSYDPIANAFAAFATVTCGAIDGTITGFSVARSGAILLMSLEPEDPMVLPYPAMQVTRFDPVGGDCDVVFYGGVEFVAPFGGSFAIDCADVAFVSTPDDPDHERLFAHSCTGGGFAMVPGGGPLLRTDLADDEPTFEHLATDEYTSVALAGTGDGRLYGVGGDGEVSGVGHVLEYDEESGALLTVTVEPALDLGEFGAYIALAFYAGDLYTFGQTFDGRALATSIHHYDLDDDDGTGTHEVIPVDPPENLPAGIIAAASPTCIPLTPAG